MEITILLYHRWCTSVNRGRNILKISQSAKWQTRVIAKISRDKISSVKQCQEKWQNLAIAKVVRQSSSLYQVTGFWFFAETL